MTEEVYDNDIDTEDNDDLFNEFADAKDNVNSVADIDSDDSDDSDGDDLPLAAQAEPQIDWQQEANRWKHRYDSDIGRQSALQRKIAEQEEMINQLKSKPADNPDGSGLSDAQWNALKEDFPEVAEAVEGRLSSITSSYEDRISQLQSQMQPIQQQAEQQFIDHQYRILESKHPDWQSVSRSGDFRNWLSNQPQAVQQLTSSDDASEASWLLDQFKLSTGGNRQQANDLKAKRQRQLQQSQTVSRRGVVNQDFESDDALFDHFAAKIDRQRRA